MKKGIVFLICLFFVVGIISWYFFEQFSYSKKYAYFNIPNSKTDSVVTIAAIGDSWVSKHSLDSLLHYYMKENGVSCNVISSGHPGAKTKKIYQNLFENKDDNFSSKFILEARPDFCIVVAGVNDASSQVGAKNYSFHTTQIIKTLLHYNIKPIVVSLPEFGIVELTNKRSFLKRLRCIVYAYLNNNNKIDNIDDYRNVFNADLRSSGLMDSVIVVNFDKVSDDYIHHLDLYRNESHLSEKGNQKLAKEISNVITNNIKRTYIHPN
ncbi:SGNH/GDSL hydrolase family protein [Chryseobacterium fistulae]|uniref:SGNH hydrolase-type esterase domain-containing protein n=1 Tax=Chryseobacterium fistulae TaxID=2675058 RepID=A0A6N4XK18_9FLAO|nr:SGNH/GDSL hydrolase family protein [Chryseobacterium fistulae]CAA7386178.1 hypothetical protein CHRY9393_00469 [Chryseobacterium fistulae]